MPSIKSKIAFQFSLTEFPADLFFWTFTWPEALNINAACAKWHDFLHARRGFCQAFPFVAGLRVFEIHPGKRVAGSEPLSHGLHVHSVIDRYVPVDIVRSIWEREGGGGRLQVKKIPRDRALYIGKYLAKARVECLGGRKLWASFGMAESTLCKDITVDSRWTETYRFMNAAIKGFDKLRYDQRARLVTHFCMSDNLDAAFKSIGMQEHVEGEEWRPEEKEAHV